MSELKRRPEIHKVPLEGYLNTARAAVSRLGGTVAVRRPAIRADTPEVDGLLTNTDPRTTFLLVKM
jgi:hypothetical protein